MEKLIITKEQVDSIWNLLNERKLLQVKSILNNLEKYKEDILRDELRRFLQNKGKSDVLKSELWNLLDETKIKLKEDKMSEEDTKSEDSGEEEKKEEESSEEKTEEAEESKEDSEDKEE